MTRLAEILAKGRLIEGHRPWPRVVVSAGTWTEVAEALGRQELTLLGLWGERRAVHMALLDRSDVAVVSMDCPDGTFPSVGRHHAPAIRLERTVRDLYGLVPDGALDTRPWLKHGESYAFLPVEGEGLHQVPVGPVHAGIIEPGHFRFTANGETVVRLEERLGYVHKGVEGLMAGADLARAAKLAGRVFRRQHGRLCLCIFPCCRSRHRCGSATARCLAPGADGRAGAFGQSSRRYRCDRQ